MNHDRMSVMISIICVCCTSNCPRGKFLRSMKVGCLGSKSALFTSLLQKQHKNITSECCLLVTFYHHLHISHVLLCTMIHWRDCDLLKTLEQWTKWIGRPGVWTLKMHEVSTHFIVGLMQSPSDSWSPQLRVSECNPFCWSQHKMCTCCIYLLLLRTQNEFVSSSSRALPSMSKVRI